MRGKTLRLLPEVPARAWAPRRRHGGGSAAGFAVQPGELQGKQLWLCTKKCQISERAQSQSRSLERCGAGDLCPCNELSVITLALTGEG